MRFKSFTLVVLMALPGFALGADAEPLPAGFTQTCAVTQSTGFDWSNERWSRTNFKEETYTARKIGGRTREIVQRFEGGHSQPNDRTELLIGYHYCELVWTEAEKNLSPYPPEFNFQSYLTYWSLTSRGMPRAVLPSCCQEIHERQGAGKPWVPSVISCRGDTDSPWSFRPNGEFHRAQLG